MRGACLAFLVSLAGCELVFPLGDEPRCEATFAAGLEDLGEVFAGGFDPSTSADPDELWFVAQTAGAKDIMFARRVGGAFETAVPEPVNTDGDDLDPAVTGDALRMVFIRNGGEIFEATRRRRGEPFGPAVALNGLPGAGGLDISENGLVLYFNDGQGELHVATRESLDAQFGAQVGLGFDGQFPSISTDQRELYYRLADGGDGIVRRRRPDRDAPFGEEELVIEGADGPLEGVDPELSHDGRTLYFIQDGRLRSTKRLCE